MKILPGNEHGLAEALRVLRSGGIVAHATETCYGFACDLTAQGSVARLFDVKKRDYAQPVSGLFVSVDHAKTYVEWNAKAQELADQFLPGPLTIILPLRSDSPATLYPTPSKKPTNEQTSQPFDSAQNRRTIGVRISSHPVAQALAAQMGRPISTTSANLHGHPNPYSAEEIVAQFRDQDIQPNVILDSGTLPPTPPSTVMNLTGEAMGILRQGNVMTSGSINSTQESK